MIAINEENRHLLEVVKELNLNEEETEWFIRVIINLANNPKFN